MHFKKLNHRDSWPPTVVHLDPNAKPATEADGDQMDEDPFHYFLTTPDDATTAFDEEDSLSAGIGSDTSEPTSPTREVSPSSIQRRPLSPDSTRLAKTLEFDYIGDFDSGVDTDALSSSPTHGFAVPLSLRDFTAAYTQSRDNKARTTPTAGSTPQPSSNDAGRGRKIVKLPSSRSPRGRGPSGSSSMTRRHAWRQPSPDVWPILEADEEKSQQEEVSTESTLKEESVLDTETPHNSAEAKAQHDLKGIMANWNDKGVVKKKAVKKRVHWAF